MFAPSDQGNVDPPPAGPLSSLTEEIAAFLAATRAEDLPAETIAKAKYFLLDWLGSAVAGLRTTAGSILLAQAAGQPGAHSSVIGLREGRDTQSAAFANGALSHITETDDVHRGAVLHPAVVVVPASLAIAERLGARGLDFLTAMALGYEVMIRVGESVGISHYYYWHNTSTCGTFGATAAAGWLLGLSEKQMAWALGNAGSMSAGLWQFNEDGAMAKHLHAGHAASSGVLAAELAAHGFTGTRFILEGKRGLYAATSRDSRPEAVTAGLARGMAHYKIEEAVIKPYPSCRHTHAPVDLALAFRHTHGLAPEQIAKIEIESYQAALSLTDNATPTHEYAAKFSTQYCVATALATGHLALSDFGPSSLADPVVLGLMSRTSLTVDPSIEVRYPREFCCRMAITTNSGQRFEEFTSSPKGDPENPLSQAELEMKFRTMLNGTPYEAATNSLIESISTLDQAAGIRSLLRLGGELRSGYANV